MSADKVRAMAGGPVRSASSILHRVPLKAKLAESQNRSLWGYGCSVPAVRDR
jgi:hypothetical protein